MTTTKSGEEYGAAHMVERQMLLHNARVRAGETNPRTATLKHRFITISREVGCLGDEIARELAGYLGWQVYDREIVDYISQNSHVRQNLVQQLDEKAQNTVHETVRRLLRMAEGGSFGIEEYHEALLKTLVSLATRGEAVLVGRGANFALRSELGFHIRIVASDEIRMERLQARWGVSREEASLRMREMDSERRNFIRHHFKHLYDDYRFYDLIFNTDHLQPDRVVASILGAVGLPQVSERSATRPVPASHPERGAEASFGRE